MVGTCDVDHVLHRDRDAPERAAVARLALELGGLGERCLGADGDVGVELAVERLDPLR